MKTRIPVIILAVLFCFLTAAADDSGTNASFQRAVAEHQQSPTDATAEKLIKVVATMNPKPDIPDEANRHFVKAATFMKKAKDKSDYQLAVKEYRQALSIAPWWGAACYNKGIALQSAGQLDEATTDFKLYLLTNPDDAAAVKNRIYAIEAEKELAAKRVVDEAVKAEEAERAVRQAFRGTWCSESGSVMMEIIASAGSYSARAPGLVTDAVLPYGWHMHNTWNYSFSELELRDRNLRFRETTRLVSSYEKGTVTDETWTDRYNLTLSDDGNKLTGTRIFRENEPHERTEKVTAFRRD
jgi:tetratricopeptide (TPR) repeat protein